MEVERSFVPSKFRKKGGILYLEGKFVTWLLDHLCSDQCNPSLSRNQSHSSNTLALNEANLFQMERFRKNFTPQTNTRCNQSNLSPSGTVEDTEKHLVRWIPFPGLVGVGADVLDLQWELDKTQSLVSTGGYCYFGLRVWCHQWIQSPRFSTQTGLRFFDLTCFLGI